MKTNNYFITFPLMIICFFFVLVSYCYGSNLKALVVDDEGKPVEYAVVTATPTSVTIKDAKKPSDVIIDQVDKEFIAYITPVQVGTTVTFPNNDKIRHHVYSFSSAKKFEIPLYPPGVDANNKVLFDKPGVVVVGCNIHDWMKAYIYVVDTPYFASSDSQGKSIVSNLPAGQYDVAVWYPAMEPKPQGQIMKISVVSGNDNDVKFAVHLTQQWRSRRSPVLGGGGGLYR
ncbi:methylamine utilization protein [Candidatus Magnetominusculus dajiuhuensis]|uniref:methylamine utilization protein n=1 Tax=Candidatus Magnetominusculus dajiuhuensis TaxID=3137712 RepID=UPI003B42A5D0